MRLYKYLIYTCNAIMYARKKLGDFMKIVDFQKERFIKAKEILKHYSISDPTIYRWCNSEKLPKPEYLNGMRVWRQSVIEKHEKQMLAVGKHVDAPNRLTADCIQEAA
jgi:predicted DNA-binding transcriptional regulator AlpA